MTGASQDWNWRALCRLSIADVPNYGGFPAVYAMRDATSKEILKFGETGHLRRRIFGNYLGGVGGQTTQRIHKALFDDGMIDKVELAWFEAKDDAEAKKRETKFRGNYKKENGRRPKWDLQG